VFGRLLHKRGQKGAFYRRPLAGGIRYGDQVLGINTIKGHMKEATGLAGLIGNFTNHSGKRTCATQLYQAGVDGQIELAISPKQLFGYISVQILCFKSVGSKDNEICGCAHSCYEPRTLEKQHSRKPSNFNFLHLCFLFQTLKV
jgi:hypothetical protein